jgi:hypothetical protein
MVSPPLVVLVPPVAENGVALNLAHSVPSYSMSDAPAPTVCTYISPRTADPGFVVAVGKPTRSDFISSPPSGADPGPTKKGISNLL